MSRAAFTSAAVAALIAAAAGGFIAGRAQHPPAETSMAVVTQAAAQSGGTPVYYQHPDGKPSYSLTPMKTPDGRDYRGVPADADLSFEEASAPEAAPADRKIKYYRNPMGLPDVSPTPKKDSMGMDYLPVYEGDESDDGSIKLSAGKIQRTGVKSEPAAPRVIRTIIRAPGTIQLDERRASIVSLRFEGFVDSVENVTTGDHVHKGQALMRVYGPSLSAAAAEYLSVLNGSLGSQALKGARRRLENLSVSEKVIAEIERTREIPPSVPWLAPQDPAHIDLPSRLQNASHAHLLGTDELGRDILSRIIYGARISMLVGVSVVAGSLFLGLIFGSVAGFYGGAIDRFFNIVVMNAFRERAKFPCQNRDRLLARGIELIARRPVQRLFRKCSQIARIKSALPKRFDDRDPIMMIVFGHKIDIGRNQRAQVIAKRDVHGRTIIERSNRNREQMLRGFRRFAGKAIGQVLRD